MRTSPAARPRPISALRLPETTSLPAATRASTRSTTLRTGSPPTCDCDATLGSTFGSVRIFGRSLEAGSALAFGDAPADPRTEPVLPSGRRSDCKPARRPVRGPLCGLRGYRRHGAPVRSWRPALRGSGTGFMCCEPVRPRTTAPSSITVQLTTSRTSATACFARNAGGAATCALHDRSADCR